MTESQYESRLNQYHQTFLRQSEILSAYQERQRSLSNEVFELRKKFDILQQQFNELMLKQI